MAGPIYCSELCGMKKHRYGSELWKWGLDLQKQSRVEVRTRCHLDGVKTGSERVVPRDPNYRGDHHPRPV